MYDRHLASPRPISQSSNFIVRRAQLLIGVTGARMAKYRTSWFEAIMACLNIVWRPQLLGVLLFEAAMFGFSVGINVG